MENIKEKITNTWDWLRALSLKQKLALGGSIVAAGLIVIPLVSYAVYSGDIEDRERLMNRGNTGIVLLDEDDNPFFSFYQAQHRADVELTSLPDHIIEALIATEDRNFYDHGGFSARGIVAAFYANLTNRQPYRYGGSTISQQLVKNLLLTHDKSYFRKYQELFLAIAVERRYDKDDILEMYLNSVYFGEGAFGIESAAQTYFDKPATELTPAESSLLVGILPAPSAFSPISGDREAAIERQQLVLESMVIEGYIDQETMEVLQAQELTFQTQPDHQNIYAHHFALMVIEELREEYEEEEIARSGFTVRTTLNLDWQIQAEEYVREQVDNLSARNVDNGSLVAIDPTNGAIRALVGSKDWDDEDIGKINMAVSPRQPGSSIKPLYYAEALDRRTVTLAEMLRDESTTFGADNYQPENFDFRYRGDISVKNSLANSLNIPSVKIMEELGVQRSADAMERMGLEIDDPQSYGLSLALGTSEQPLLRMVNAYAAFANQGLQHEPVAIRSVHDKYGQQIFENNDQNSRVISEEAAFLISSALADEEARAPLFGYIPINRPVAVKSGTTEDSRDALVIGYTPSLAVGVWIGNNDNRPMDGVGGSSGAGPIWINAMRSFLANTPAENFERPDGIVVANICRDSGHLAESAFAGTYREFFIRGTLPDETCSPPPPEDDDDDEDSEPGRTEDDEDDDDEDDDDDDEDDDEDDEDDDEEDNGQGPNGDGPPGQQNN